MTNTAPSTDVIRLALRAVAQGACSPGFAGQLLLRAARQDGDDPLELRSVLDSDRLPPAPRDDAHVHCPDCRSVFRVHMQDLDNEAACPLCEAALVFPLSDLRRNADRARPRAAEAEPRYKARRVNSDAQRFAHFDLLSRLGSGGAGRVYRARNRRTDRQVALKLCRFSPVESQAVSWRRAMREVEAAALQHPNIVRVFHAGLAEGVPYIEMEYVPGGCAKDRRALGPTDAGDLVKDVLSALSHAHDSGVVHRDLKPANVLLDEDGRAKVSDFGLCKLLHESSSTTTGKILGSPHFMAPEQWTDGEVGPYTDVYAAGLLFYFLLTGALPYRAEDPLSIMYKHLYFELPDPREETEEVPGTLVDLLRKATARKPQDRFADAGECLEALDDVL